MRDYRLVEDSTLCPPWCLSLSATGLLRKEEPGFLRKLLNRSIVKYSDHNHSLCNVANRLFFFNLFAVISAIQTFCFCLYIILLLMLCVWALTSKKKLVTDSC